MLSRISSCRRQQRTLASLSDVRRSIRHTHRETTFWDRSTKANERVIVTYDLVSRGGLFALSTTSGQCANTCIGWAPSAL
jgi:hypothetical protein